jgi:hypothetical protein
MPISEAPYNPKQRACITPAPSLLRRTLPNIFLLLPQQSKLRHAPTQPPPGTIYTPKAPAQTPYPHHTAIASRIRTPRPYTFPHAKRPARHTHTHTHTHSSPPSTFYRAPHPTPSPRPTTLPPIALAPPHPTPHVPVQTLHARTRVTLTRRPRRRAWPGPRGGRRATVHAGTAAISRSACRTFGLGSEAIVVPQGG